MPFICPKCGSLKMVAKMVNYVALTTYERGGCLDEDYEPFDNEPAEAESVTCHNCGCINPLPLEDSDAITEDTWEKRVVTHEFKSVEGVQFLNDNNAIDKPHDCVSCGKSRECPVLKQKALREQNAVETMTVSGAT